MVFQTLGPQQRSRVKVTRGNEAAPEQSRPSDIRPNNSSNSTTIEVAAGWLETYTGLSIPKVKDAVLTAVNDTIAGISESIGTSKFDSEEVERMRQRFMKLNEANSNYERDEFLTNPLAPRMIAMFNEDKGGNFDFQEFVSGLTAFSSKGNRQEKLRFAFNVYDIDRDGYISNGDLFIVSKMMVGSNLKDQQLQKIVDKTIAEADLDGDGKISFEEFAKMVDDSSQSLGYTFPVPESSSRIEALPPEEHMVPTSVPKKSIKALPDRAIQDWDKDGYSNGSLEGLSRGFTTESTEIRSKPETKDLELPMTVTQMQQTMSDISPYVGDDQKKQSQVRLESDEHEYKEKQLEVRLSISSFLSQKGSTVPIKELSYLLLTNNLEIDRSKRPNTWSRNCWNTIVQASQKQPEELDNGIKRLKWTCKCGHRSYDDFKELQNGTIIELANDMFEAGYITHAQVSGQASGGGSDLVLSIRNLFIGARRSISGWRSSTLLPFFSKSSIVQPIELPCLPNQDCRWLHMCLKKPPYATKLEPLHVCKDDDKNNLTDATFFQSLRRAYFGSKNWRERMLFKLKRIDFVEFEVCPGNLIDHILPDKLPPTIEEYDFAPPPPPKKCPPIGTSHMMHLFTSCSAQPLNTSLYLRHIPKRKETALSFRPDSADAITGWGLHFVESLNSALAVTVMFTVSLILGIVFAIYWSVWRHDIQGAFGVASYVTSVITLAIMTWQMWAI